MFVLAGIITVSMNFGLHNDRYVFTEDDDDDDGFL